MSADAVLADAARAGLTLAAKGGRLSVIPASKLAAELRDRLVRHREEILHLISSAPSRSRAWHIQFTDGTTCTALHSTPHSADEALVAAEESFGAARICRVSHCA